MGVNCSRLFSVFLSYYWHVEGIGSAEARGRFHDILDAQRAMYSSSWNRPVSVTLHQQGNTLVGQLYSDPGVTDWKPWIEGNGSGLVWSGVCETFLGTQFDAEKIQDIETTLARSPQRVCDWDGNFYVISWGGHGDSVYLTTGATECPTLWYTEGPCGWAAGSRGEPILEMVGRERRISTAASNVFLSYGHNYSDASLLEHVYRVPQRTRIIARPGSRPRMSRYATLQDYLGQEVHYAGWDERLVACADRLTARVARQLRYSTHPEVLVTGGRDSRCIAAAAKRAGYAGVLSTGGAADSRDVVIGGQVADRLKLSHLHTSDRVPMDQFSNAVDRLRLWSSMSEGAEVIRHARAYNRFVAGELEPVAKQQRFHGLGGEIGRGYYYQSMGNVKQLHTSDYTIGRQILSAAAKPDAPMTRDARALVEARWDSFSEDFGVDQGTVAHWLDMFFWQNSCLRWGADMLSVKSTMYWTWAPFLDRELIRSYRGFELEDKRSNRFIQDLAVTLANELAGLEYDVTATRKKPERSMGKRLLTRARRSLRYGLGSRPGVDAQQMELKQFWEKVLLGASNPFWKECIDENGVRKLMRYNPSSYVLWNAATIQLVAEANS
jgi:hypothetical protein